MNDGVNNLSSRLTSTKEHNNANLKIPLLPLMMHNNQSPPPLANPETADLGGGDTPPIMYPTPGVDDGFFENRAGANNPDAEELPPKTDEAEGVDSLKPPTSVTISSGRGSHPEKPLFGFTPNFGTDLEVGSNAGDLDSIPDVNVYQHKKTLAQGMMDLALFSANANQLRYVIETFKNHPYYYPSVILISFSLILQVAIGIGLIWNATYNVKDDKEICIANKISNFTIIGIFLVTVINVFISAFGVAPAQ